MSGLCLFGGSFNPPHRTHRRIVEQAMLRLKPDRLLVMPCAQNPLKPEGHLAPAADRVAMCRLAFRGLQGVEVSTLEIDRQGPSYAIDTVRALRAQIGLDAPLWLLCGSDQLPDLDRWREQHSLLELATLVVFPRAGYPIDAKVLDRVGIRRKHKEEIVGNALDCAPDTVSATAVRAALARGETPIDLAPEVAAYVREHGLYRSAGAGA
ncbi:MAG: nicotinate (nicotinamide) nucleotide adenylyltransferase [Planctomycetota bacterium]